MTVIVQTGTPGPAPAQAVTTPPTFYASFWRRLMAAAIDSIIMVALVVGILVSASVTIGLGNDITVINNGNTVINKDGRMIPLSEIAKPQIVITRDGPQTITVETTTATVGLQTIHSVVTRTTVAQTGGGGQPRTSTSSDLTQVPSPLAFVLLFALWLLYTSILESSRLQGTLGKRAMFIRVADEEGRRVNLLRALARNTLKVISAFPLCIGFLMTAWTAKKQALHDILAKCTVYVERGSALQK